MADSWDAYVTKFDKLVQEAIRVAVKTSMASAYEILHGDSTTGPNPLVNVSIDLKDNKVRLFKETKLSQNK